MSEAVQVEEVNTMPVEDSVTKEMEDALYPSDDSASKVEEDTSEKTTLVSEDPIEDKVAKTEEDKSEEEKPEKSEDDKEKEDSGEAISYELKLSDESRLGAEALEEVKAFAEENKLSNEAAQAMLKREEDAISNYITESEAALDAQVEEWRGAVVADKSLGGENFEKTKADSRKAVERFGSEEFVNILNSTGYGNNPFVVSFLAQVGSLMSDDSLVIGGGEPKQEKQMHEYFYK